MKRIVAVLATSMVLGLMPPAHAQDASAGLRTGQFALAMWTTYRDGKPHTFYVAVIDRAIAGSPAVVETYVLAAKGRCKSRKMFSVCSAGGTMHEASLEEATFDPLQESASMSYRGRRYTHTAVWVGHGEGAEPAPYVERYGEEGYNEVYAGADSYRWANASGKLFGRRMKSRMRDAAFMWQGTWGYAYSISSTDVSISRDGFVKVTTRR